MLYTEVEGEKKKYSSLILQKKKCWYFTGCLLNDIHGRLKDGTPQKLKNTFSLQQAFGFVQRAFIIIRNVIALLLLKDRGRGEKKDQAQRYKVRAEH